MKIKISFQQITKKYQVQSIKYQAVDYIDQNKKYARTKSAGE